MGSATGARRWRLGGLTLAAVAAGIWLWSRLAALTDDADPDWPDEDPGDDELPTRTAAPARPR